MNWQQVHEEILEMLNRVAGKRVRNFELDTAHLSGLKRKTAIFLNKLNDFAVQMYYNRAF